MKKKLRKIETQTIMKASVAMLVLTVMSYVDLVNTATFNTAKTQNLSERVGILQSQISDLELSYIDKVKAISIEDAGNFALVANKKETKKVLVSRDSASRLTLNIE